MTKVRCPICGGQSLHYANCWLATPDMEVYTLSAFRLERPRIYVCGGRAYANGENVFRHLDRLHPSSVGEGGQTGADAWANAWAYKHLEIEHAQYQIEPGEDPFARNIRAFNDFKPNLILAFLGGNGTAHMKLLGRNNGVWVTEVIG